MINGFAIMTGASVYQAKEKPRKCFFLRPAGTRSPKVLLVTGKIGRQAAA
jgi:hypothetical protein